jgi:hypothetical protein
MMDRNERQRARQALHIQCCIRTVPDMDELDAALARRLRAALENQGLRREDIAQLMTGLGFRWTGNTVTQVITDRRALSVLELAGVCEVLKRPLGELLGRQHVGLPSGAVSSVDVVSALTHGRSDWRAHRRGELTPAEQSDYERFFPPEHDEATIKAARRLGVAPFRVLEAAVDLWGHTLASERDRRVIPADDDTPRALQARRGHATRALIDELREHLDRGSEGDR